MNHTTAFFFLSRVIALPYLLYPSRRCVDEFKKLDETDWPQILKIADRHLVLPSLYWSLKKLETLSLCPQKLQNLLFQSYQLNIARNKMLQEQALNIGECLSKNDIEPLFLKGMAGLLNGIYPDSGLRIMGDIDLLVPKETYTECINLIKEAGYRNLQGFDPNFFNPDIRHHAHPLVHDDAISCIEVHQMPVTLSYQPLLTTEEMLKTSNLHADGKSRYRVPDPTRFILHNLIHAQVSPGGSFFGQVHLYQMLDVLAVNKSLPDQIDWPEIKHRYDTSRYKRAFYFYEELYRNLFKYKIPIGVPKKQKPSHAWRIQLLQMKYSALNTTLFFLRYFYDIGIRVLTEKAYRKYIFTQKLNRAGIQKQFSKLLRLFLGHMGRDF